MNMEDDILIVDDEIPNLQLLTGLLEKEGYQVRPAERAQTALDSALAKPPQLILLDVRMPEMDGFELCRRLKQDKRTEQVPIIFVSALQDTEARIQGFEAGGVDFISKPFQEPEILVRVRTHVNLHRMQQHLELLVDERTAEVTESKARFQYLVENANETIVVAQDEAVKYCNPKISELTGYTPEEMLSRGFDAFIHPGDLEMVMSEYRTRVSGERPTSSYSIRIITKGGQEKHAFVNSALVDWDGKPATLAMLTDITELKQAEMELRDAFEDIEQLKNRLEAESAYLQDEIKLEHNFKNIIGKSESLKYVLHRVELVAPTDSPVLIMGETGTGKELMARALHELSPHGKRALVKVNCAALPGELIESELFGREKGAFTGATATQLGRFELAKGSTIFLDEIGELPLELQAKLLRVIESGEFERLGSSRTLHSDARIIAATNRVLEQEVRKGRFREDLWYRLKVFPITVPPLREHPEDISLLVKWFLNQSSRKIGKPEAEIPKRTMQMLQSYPWPGNVRELKHAVESALIISKGKNLQFELPQIKDTAPSDFKSFEEMERDYILRVLKAKNWRIGGENSAASTLGMHVNTLRGRMKKLGIKKPKPQ
jgi:PAS domain S-box-containing protein